MRILHKIHAGVLKVEANLQQNNCHLERQNYQSSEDKTRDENTQSDTC